MLVVSHKIILECYYIKILKKILENELKIIILTQ